MLPSACRYTSSSNTLTLKGYSDGSSNAYSGWTVTFAAVLTPDGGSCTSSSQCTHGTCSGGYCCALGITAATCSQCVIGDGSCSSSGCVSPYVYNSFLGSCATAMQGGQTCSAGSDCASGTCLSSVCCASAIPHCIACGSSAGQCTVCGTGYYLSGGYCVAQASAGASCTSGQTCASGSCLGNYCCSSSNVAHCTSCASGSGSCNGCSTGYSPSTGSCTSSAVVTPTVATGGVCTASNQCLSGAACLGGVCCGTDAPVGCSACDSGTGQCNACGSNGQYAFSSMCVAA